MFLTTLSIAFLSSCVDNVSRRLIAKSNSEAMFKLVTVEDTLQIPPHLFGYAPERAIEYVVNRQLSDRVVLSVGLVIALWDIESLSVERLVPTSGDAHLQCRYRILVFAPFRGEAIFSRVRASTQAGLLAYLDFFEPLWVPSDALPKPSTFDLKDRVWIWRPNFDGVQMEYFMDVNTESVIRVNEVLYNKSKRTAITNTPEKSPPVMSVTAVLHDSVSDDNQGLGDPTWWFEEDDPAAPEADDGILEGDQEGVGGGGDNIEEDYNADATGPFEEGNAEDWQDEGLPGGDLVYEDGAEDAVDAEEVADE